MKAIVACDTHYGLGIHNTLPNWKLKNDLKTFKTLTQRNGNNGKKYVVVNRRKTFTKPYEFCIIYYHG